MNPVTAQNNLVPTAGSLGVSSVKPTPEPSSNAGQTQASSQVATEVTQKNMERVVADLAQAVNGKLNVGLNVDSNTNKLVIMVTDPDSGDLIRQIPSEDALARADRIRDLSNLIFDQKV
ncbi:MAG: flagellar protein FlaG [Litorivicinus sp.]